MKLYHKDVGFPPKMKFKAVEGLIPSSHALRERDSDRYGKFDIPTSFDPLKDEVIEIETANGALNKIVARRPIDEKRDVVFVFLPLSKLVKTCWVNERNDLHKTLDKSAYARP
jgi:hypothetical protein